jgi:hypothetical protein
MSLLVVISEPLSSKPSNNFENSKKSNNENVNKQELIGDCLYFYLVNLLRCVDVILNKIGEGGFWSVYLCFNGKNGYSDLFHNKQYKYILSNEVEIF